MKHVFRIVAAVLFLSVCLVPADDAPLKTFFLWAVYAVCTLALVRLIVWRLEDDEKAADSTGAK